jgi:sirohydrochlorin ferrochelatase
MKSVIIIAHGSRRSNSNEEFIAFVESIKNFSDDHQQSIKPAFLELGSPTLSQAIQVEIDNGATQIDILPYFLSAGVHVNLDIPKHISKAENIFPGCTFTILPYVGALPGMHNLVLSQISFK